MSPISQIARQESTFYRSCPHCAAGFPLIIKTKRVFQGEDLFHKVFQTFVLTLLFLNKPVQKIYILRSSSRQQQQQQHSSLYSLIIFFGGNIKWHEFATSLLKTKIAPTPNITSNTTAQMQPDGTWFSSVYSSTDRTAPTTQPCRMWRMPTTIAVGQYFDEYARNVIYVHRTCSGITHKLSIAITTYKDMQLQLGMQ